MKLAAMSWKAKPRARPRMPAPASNEATVFCRPTMPSEMKKPAARKARNTVWASSRVTCSLWETRFSRRSRRFRTSLAASQKPTSTSTATARLGSSRMKSRVHPNSFSTSRFQVFSIPMTWLALCNPQARSARPRHLFCRIGGSRSRIVNNTARAADPREVPMVHSPKVLLVYPVFPPSYWGFQYALELAGKHASMPPLGLLTVAAMIPGHYQLRLVDMNVAPLTDADLDWSDLVLTSTMVVQQ